MIETHIPQMRITLRGHEPKAATVDLLYQPRRKRLLRALLYLVISWALLPIVALLPPHWPWALAGLVMGPYFAYKEWTGVYLVRSFAGSCPRCGNELTIKPGSKIRLPSSLTCFQCHHDPVLEVQRAVLPQGIAGCIPGGRNTTPRERTPLGDTQANGTSAVVC